MEFNTFSELQKYSDAFKTFKPKEKVFIKEEKIFYELDDNNVWQPLAAPVVETGQTIAEVKTAIFTELGPLTEGQLKLIPEIIATFEKQIDQKHYMFMCKQKMKRFLWKTIIILLYLKVKNISLIRYLTFHKQFWMFAMI